jgi:hypothetical protein
LGNLSVVGDTLDISAVSSGSSNLITELLLLGSILACQERSLSLMITVILGRTLLTAGSLSVTLDTHLHGVDSRVSCLLVSTRVQD